MPPWAMSCRSEFRLHITSFKSATCDPEEYMAIEIWLPDDGDKAFDTLEMFREKLEKSLILGTEKMSMTKGETKKTLGAIPKSSNLDMKSENSEKITVFDEPISKDELIESILPTSAVPNEEPNVLDKTDKIEALSSICSR